MNILFLSAWYPFPPDNGSKLRIYNLLRGLAQQHTVTLITFTDQPQSAIAPELNALCARVHVIPSRAYDPNSLRARLGFLSPTPRVIVDTFVPAMAQRIQREASSGQYDVVIASQWRMAAYWQSFSNLPAILDEIEVGGLESRRARASSALQRLRATLPLLKLKFYLRRLLPRFQLCTVASQAEGALVRRMAPHYGNVEVVPNCLNLADYAGDYASPKLNSLIFAGSLRYRPNYDAMTWFLEEMYPLIQAQVPDICLTITGDHADLPLPSASNVVRTGFVEDVRPYIASAWASVSPIRLGGGTRLKILEAMALRVPVVTTSKGVEGIDARHGEHLLIADTPETFAQAVVQVSSPTLRQQLVDRAYRLVVEEYDWSVVAPRFLDLVHRVAHTTTARFAARE